MDGSNDPQVHNLPKKKKSLDTQRVRMLDGLNDKQNIIKTMNVWMAKTTKTKNMSYPRLIKALNKDLDFYEESLDNIYPRLVKKFIDIHFDEDILFSTTKGLRKVFRQRLRWYPRLITVRWKCTVAFKIVFRQKDYETLDGSNDP